MYITRCSLQSVVAACHGRFRSKTAAAIRLILSERGGCYHSGAKQDGGLTAVADLDGDGAMESLAPPLCLSEWGRWDTTI
jgi:hypothetical protein